MSTRLTFFTIAATALLSVVAAGQNLPWNNPGGTQGPAAPQTGPAAPAPKRDLSGIWDAGGAGIGARGMPRRR